MRNSVSSFCRLMRDLAAQHEKFLHSDKECHFSTNIDAAQNSFARKMHYPCIVMDYGDFTYTSLSGADGKRRNVTLLFLDHVKDTGNSAEIEKVFDEMEDVCDDFMIKITELSKSKDKAYRFLSRFSLDGVAAERISLESPALFGWAVTIVSTDMLCSADDPWAYEQYITSNLEYVLVRKK